MNVTGKRVLYNETDWGKIPVENCKEKGRDAAGSDKYEASKILSERAAWDFIEEHKNEVKFDLVAINPGLILGPALHEVNSPQELNTSLQLFYLGVCMGHWKGDELLVPR